MKTFLIGFFFCIAGIIQAQTPDTVIIVKEKDYALPVFNFNQPLFMLNGKKFSADSLFKLNPTSIESIHIVRAFEAKEKYGDEGKNGAVIIQLKEIAKKEED